MKQKFTLLCCSLVNLVLSPISIAAENNPLWHGSMGLQYSARSADDGLSGVDHTSQANTSVQKTKTLDYKASLNAEGKVEELDWNFGIRTSSAAHNAYRTAQQSQDFTAGIEYAWLRYADNFFGGSLHATLGRQAGNFLEDTFTENLFSQDIRFDGLGWHWQRGIFSLQLGQYSLGAINSGSKSGSSYTATEHGQSQTSVRSSMAYLVTAQPSVQVNFSTKIRTQLAVGLFSWNKTDGFFTNTIHGGINSQSYGATTGSIAIDNPMQLQIYNSWSLPFETEIFGEWYKNKKMITYTSSSVGARRDAFSVGLHFGKLEKVKGVQASYAYLEKGLGAIPNDYSSNAVFADNKGHLVSLSYSVLKNLQLRGRYYQLQEIGHKNVNGIETTSAQKNETKMYKFIADFNF